MSSSQSMSSSPGEVFMCPECDYTTLYEDVIAEHVMGHVSVDNSSGREHMRPIANPLPSVTQHHPQPRQLWLYMCVTCNINFAREVDMDRHFDRKHKHMFPGKVSNMMYKPSSHGNAMPPAKLDENNGAVSFPYASQKANNARHKCKKCDFVGTSQQSLAGHVGRRHIGQNITTRRSQKKSEQRDASPIRKKYADKDNTSESSIGDKHWLNPVYCEDCGKEYSNVGNYNMHVKTDKHRCQVVFNRHKYLDCPYCRKNFDNVTDFLYHKRKQHSGTILLTCTKCVICKFITKNRDCESAINLHKASCGGIMS